MLKKHVTWPLILISAMVAVLLIEALIPGDLSWLGIRPRSLPGLVGVPLSPFLHADLFHLISNALPILVMGAMVSALDRRLFIYRTLVMILGSGLLTWLISTPAVVIGASGLVFAYWSYLIVNGFRSKKIKDIIFALITIIVYGGLLISLLKHVPGVSWAGHFSGALVGAVFAWLGSGRQRRRI